MLSMAAPGTGIAEGKKAGKSSGPAHEHCHIWSSSSIGRSLTACRWREDLLTKAKSSATISSPMCLFSAGSGSSILVPVIDQYGHHAYPGVREMEKDLNIFFSKTTTTTISRVRKIAKDNKKTTTNVVVHVNEGSLPGPQPGPQPRPLSPSDFEEIDNRGFLYFPLFLRSHWIAGILVHHTDDSYTRTIDNSAPLIYVHRDIIDKFKKVEKDLKLLQRECTPCRL
eukprot:gene9503-6672_t